MENKLRATRDALGTALIELAEKDGNIFAFDCDLGRSTRSFSITESDRKRFIEMGIAEQDMVSTAAGLASTGKTVFVNTFAVFLTGRAYDQIRQQVALPKNNVKICGSSAGLTQGADGATHQSVTDINLMRGLPNMQVFVPADFRQAEEIVKWAAGIEGPVYIRLSRYDTPDLVPAELGFTPGKLQKISSGKGSAILVSGPLLHHCRKAVSLLSEKGINTALYNCPSIKPLDRADIEALASEYDSIFTVEEHSIIGGLGSAVAEILASIKTGKHAVLHRLGMEDCFGESASAEELLAKYGLDSSGIAERVAAEQ